MRGDSLGLLSADFVIKEKVVGPSGSVVQLLGQDPTRWAIVFSCANSGVPCWVSTLPTVTTNQGLLLPQQTPVLSMNFRDVGALVTLAWFGFGAAASEIDVIEVLYRPAGLLTTGEGDLELVEETLRKWGRS